MRNVVWTALTLALFSSPAAAQDYGNLGPSNIVGPQNVYDPSQAYGPVNVYPQVNVYGQEAIGSPTPSASEPLYKYDDLEVWKHGWLQINPYEHGYHSYRPYNYKQVFAQAAQSSQWGMPSTMPYSQTYYLRHGHLTGINGDPLPLTEQGLVPTPPYNAPGYGAPVYPKPVPGLPGDGMPTSMLREQPFGNSLSPQQLNNVPGLTQLPGHQFPQQQPANTGGQSQTITPADFQQFHQNPPSGPEYERLQMQKYQFQQILKQSQSQQQGPSFR